MSSNEIGKPTFFVVRNEEEQYSIWRSDKPVPAGWQTVGHPKDKDQCLTAIEELWADMRPLSLRRAHDLASVAPYAG